MTSLQTLAVTALLAASSVFVTFALKWNYAWAALCLVGAVYFIFQ